MRVDLGTGDGRAVLAAAAANSRLLVIGVDASAAGMVDASRRAMRSRDGSNALFVVAAAERLPPELNGLADEVTVNFPWGSLLRGLLGADDAVLGGLARIMKPGAALSILLSVTDQDRGAGVAAIEDGAALSALVGPYAAQGLAITEIRPLAAADVAAAGSSWGKRLGAGTRRPAWLIAARRAAAGQARAG
ncbi:class I SAM-dependent methyltransferase [Nocardia transvalensis]|uniref:16S rRNA (adenine(1408)-N(1))-methyltransferase WarA n=1 Tax=Nocardia transvalensis TaxID=37333 RepID=UPI001895B836|nr:class I SAM-dependent methyltransferase [Nocardia transvalensis]MBF6331043.1 methyltransferase domain-containing protein [Nocardia transvalensis]